MWGSFALSASQTDLFLMALNGLLQHLCAVINRQAVQELTRVELWGRTRLFRASAPSCATTTRASLAETLDTLTRGELLTPDESIEAFIRETLDLPSKQLSKRANHERKGETEHDNRKGERL